MKFLVDAQLPPVLAQALCEAGYEAKAVRELGLREADDSVLWNYALSNQTVIITKDQDFAERQLASPFAPVIVWLKIGNSSNQALLSWLLPLWPQIIQRIESGDYLIEVRERR